MLFAQVSCSACADAQWHGYRQGQAEASYLIKASKERIDVCHAGAQVLGQLLGVHCQGLLSTLVCMPNKYALLQA